MFFVAKRVLSRGLIMMMNLETNDIEKKYYSISEVAQMFQVNTSLIRYWESEFDTIRPQKNKRGERRFTQEDIKDLKIIYHLVKEKGYTLEGAKEYLKREAKAEEQRIKSIETLKQLKKFLTELRDSLP